MNETIVAEATPPGRGGIAVIRISGPKTQSIASSLLGKLPKPRHASYQTFKDQLGQVLDEGIAIFFPNPHSFTGEDVLELHGHGGPAVVNLLIQEIVALGARLASPGEFSERAFLNNKMDLMQAEAIADLIHATHAQAARACINSLQGQFSQQIHSLLEALIQLRMYIEAAIDFSDEEIDFLSDQGITEKMAALINDIETITATAEQGKLLNNGINLVITGKPNVGKSSLLNALSGHDAAIVTDIPGTTRDVLRESLNLDGMPLNIIDTAGLRVSCDPVEKEGIKRAHAEIERADLILYVIDQDETILTELSHINVPIIIIRNKIDLNNEMARVVNEKENTLIALSAKTGLGLDLLKQEIKSKVGFKPYVEGTFSARRRHIDALQRAKQHVKQSKMQLSEFKAGELVAEDLRQAQLALNEITGEFTSDDLLGKIFSSFCIGK